MHLPRMRVLLILSSAILIVLYLKSTFKLAAAIISLQATWWIGASDFYISEERDHFDATFANYSVEQQSVLPEYPDLVPAVLHQISLGRHPERQEWVDARKACVDLHPDWELHFWTDENASKFVEEKFPHLKAMWDGYQYPIQRVDALRYMILYEYGGAVLDLDLHCLRSLGPLRRFGFIAPAAHPVGFSNGMLMSSQRHPFAEALVSNLPAYNLNWFWLPYPTVMFSTGCHYASTIHALQENRTDLRILSGTADNPNLHQLNGNVVTPLFHHLGASSWQSYDAFLIYRAGQLGVFVTLFCFVSIALVVYFLVISWVAFLHARVAGSRKIPSTPKILSPVESKSASFDFGVKSA